MRVLVVSYLLFCCLLGRGSVFGIGNEDISLNLQFLDESRVNTSEKFLKDVKYTMYEPVGTSVFGSVSDGINPLWIAEKGEYCLFSRFISKEDEPPLLFLHIVNSGGPGHKHFEKKGSSWVSITEREFFEKQNELYTGPWPKVQLESPLNDKIQDLEVLDIANTDLSKFSVKTNNDSGIEYKEYSPKGDFSIASIVEDGAKVWSAPKDVECKLVNSYKKGSDIFLTASISNGLKNDVRYLEKRSGILWTSIPVDQFQIRLEGLKTGSIKCKIIPNEPYTLDLANIDDKKVHTSIYNNNGFNNLQYSVLGKLELVSIVDEKTTIWKAKDGEECLTVLLSYKDDVRLLSVRVRLGNDSSVLRFEKEYGKWSRVSEKVYLRKLYGSSFDETLDISKLAPENAHLSYDINDEIPYKQYIPKTELFSKVVDGEEDVWETKYNKLCRRVDVYSRGGVKLVRVEAKVYSLVEDEYFKKTADKAWERIWEMEYTEELERMRDYTSKDRTFTDDEGVAPKNYDQYGEELGEAKESRDKELLKGEIIRSIDYELGESEDTCPVESKFLHESVSVDDRQCLQRTLVGYASLWERL